MRFLPPLPANPNPSDTPDYSEAPWLRSLDKARKKRRKALTRQDKPPRERKPRTKTADAYAIKYADRDPRAYVQRLNPAQLLYNSIVPLTDTCFAASKAPTPTLWSRKTVRQAVKQAGIILENLGRPDRLISAGQAEWIRDHARICILSLRDVLRYANAPEYVRIYPSHQTRTQLALDLCEQIERACVSYMHRHPGPYDQSRFSAWCDTPEK